MLPNIFNSQSFLTSKTFHKRLNLCPNRGSNNTESAFETITARRSRLRQGRLDQNPRTMRTIARSKAGHLVEILFTSATASLNLVFAETHR